MGNSFRHTVVLILVVIVSATAATSTVSAAVKPAAPATVGTLRAAGNGVGGGAVNASVPLLELRRTDYDVLARSRSAVTLGWPRRSRAFPRRCSTVRVSLRVLSRSGPTGPMLRDLLPRVAASGQIAVNNPGATTVASWGIRLDVTPSLRTALHGLTLLPLSRATAALTVTGRNVRYEPYCEGPYWRSRIAPGVQATVMTAALR